METETKVCITMNAVGVTASAAMCIAKLAGVEGLSWRACSVPVAVGAASIIGFYIVPFMVFTVILTAELVHGK